jgi:3-deoxy-7-phosphoheptulonate synthase
MAHTLKNSCFYMYVAVRDYQPITYKDTEILDACIKELATKEPLVTEYEVSVLSSLLADAQERPETVFILQMGHCAELFDSNCPNLFQKFAKLIGEIKCLFPNAIQLVPMLRMAGQFAKPRSCLHEVVDGHQVTAYRGDLVNGCSNQERQPDPRRLLRAYKESSLALSYIENAFGALVYTMHECLSLPYEEALCRHERGNRENKIHQKNDEILSLHDGPRYAGSAHMLWLGDRTAFPDSAHARFLSSINNPIAIKIGPSKSPEILISLLNLLNPNKTPGRVAVVTRLGAHQVSTYLSSIFFV